MTMAARTQLALLVALAALLGAQGASAKIYWTLRPRATLMGGFDDNVMLDGRGMDGYGQVVPGLKLDLFGEHNLHLDLDCQAGVARLAHPERFGLSGSVFANNESCAIGTRARFSPRDALRFFSRLTYAQDPFAIAGMGLLLRPGQSQIFVGRLGFEVQHTLTPRSQFDIGTEAQLLAFSTGDPGNGYLLTPYGRYLYRSSPQSTWDLGVREQLFFGIGAQPNPLAPQGTPGGLLEEGHTALVGYTYKLAPHADLIVRGGPLFLTGSRGERVMPVARFEIESVTPSTAVHLMVAHDLVIGPNTAGPLVGDIAELGWMYEFGRLSGHLRAGLYRNAGVYTNSVGAIGYSGELAIDWSLTRELKIGIAGLRDARLNDVTIEHQVDRDVVQLRLTWEKARFE
jgi:hypothetical protein